MLWELLQEGYLSLWINIIFLSGASFFLEVNNYKHLYLKRNSDISWNRMQNSYEFLRENRRLQRELGYVGRESQAMQSLEGTEGISFVCCWCTSAGKFEKY